MRIRYLMLIFLTSISILSQTMITGKVVDKNTNELLVGTNVYISGSKIGAVTNEYGEFALNVPEDLTKGVLVVTFLGYKTFKKELTFDVDNDLEIQLEEDFFNSEEIVVTGFGTGISKKKLGITIAKVKSEEIKNSGESNIVSSLAGKVANVEVTSSSGEPGASSFIRIRGTNTVNGSAQPLFVFDGVPVDNSEVGTALGGVSTTNRAADFNPDDIESIEILKGAAASAMYGSRAANGVVLITTKKGRAGKTVINYRTSYSNDAVNKTVPLQKQRGQNAPGSSLSYGSILSGSTPVYDHSDELFQTGHKLEHSLSISGGHKGATYIVSASRTDQTGTIISNSNYEKTTFRASGELALSKKVDMGASLNYAFSHADFIQKGSNVSGLMLGMLRTPPDFNNKPFINPDGTQRTYRNPSGSGKPGYDNPFWTIENSPAITDVQRVFGNMFLNYFINKKMTLKYRLGSDFSNDFRNQYIQIASAAEPDGKIIDRSINIWEVDHSLTLDYKTDINKDMSVSFLLGQNINYRYYESKTVTGTSLAASGYTQNENASTVVPNAFERSIKTTGYFLQGNLDYLDQLYITAAIRRDASSTFGESKKDHWFPKFSIAWEASKNDFMKSDILTFFKIRFALGQAGLQPNAYASQTLLALGGNFGDGYLNNGIGTTYLGYVGATESSLLGNKDIATEVTTEKELGFDFRLFGNFADISLTTYLANSKDVIIRSPLPRSSGFSTIEENVAELENKGIELTADLNLINNDAVTWRTSLSWAKNWSDVVDLKGANFISLGGFTSVRGGIIKGEPIGSFWGRDWIRDANGQIIIYSDGRPRRAAEDAVIGDPNPDWTGSVRNTVTYKGFTLSTLIDIKYGGDVWNGTKGALYYFGTHAETAPGKTADFSGVDESGNPTSVKIPIDQSWAVSGPGSGFTGPGSQFIEDGGFVKLREVSLSYELGKDIVQQVLKLSAVNFTFTARNLFTWTDYTGIDPETNLSGGSRLRGFDYFNNPQTRSFIFTTRITL